MIKKLDRYILRHFFVSLFVVIVAIGLTIVVLNMVSELHDFIDHDVPIFKVLEYYVYFAGWIVKSFMPMFVLLAVLFSISMLARRQEILAMKASGRSLYRIAAPLMVVTLLIAAGHFYYNEHIYPPANQKRVEMKNFIIERRSRAAHRKVRDVYRQISPGSFYTMASFDVDRAQGDNFKLYRTEGNELTEIVTATKVIYHEYNWRAVDGIRRHFVDGERQGFYRFDTLVVADIQDKPENLAKRIGKPEDMSLQELEDYIDLMKRTGGPHVRESVDLKLKYSFPLGSVIVVLICVPYASNPRKGGIAISFAMGTLIAVVFFVLFRVFQSSGYNGKLPEDIAAWGVNGLFFIVGAVLMLRARK